MAVVSSFYDTAAGVGLKETEWAKSARSRGSIYGVAGAGDLKLTAHPTTAYAVDVAVGTCWGHGVWDVSDAVVTVQCATPAAGVTRWDLIAAHRDWQPTGGGPTSFTAIAGTATKAIPSGRVNNPGVIDDQPLFLVRWLGGQTQPQEIVDLRCWAGPGGVVAVDKLVLDYLNVPGAAVHILQSTWRYEPGTNGVFGWKISGYSAADIVTFGPTWTPLASPHDPRVERVGERFFLSGGVKIGSNADFANMLTIPAGFRPVTTGTIFVGAGVSSTGVAYELALTGGVLSVPDGYRLGSPPVGSNFPVTCSWPVN